MNKKETPVTGTINTIVYTLAQLTAFNHSH